MDRKIPIYKDFIKRVVSIIGTKSRKKEYMTNLYVVPSVVTPQHMFITSLSNVETQEDRRHSYTVK